MKSHGYLGLCWLLAALSACAPKTPAARLPGPSDAALSAVRLHTQGAHAAERGDGVRAEQYLTAALRTGHAPKATLGLLLAVCLENAHVRTALSIAEPQLEANPDDVRLRYLVATLKYALDDDSGAQRELVTLLQRDPTHEGARALLSSLDRAEAREHALLPTRANAGGRR